MELETLFAELFELMNKAKEEHDRFVEKGIKKAEANTRMYLNEIKKKITPYKQASTGVTKQMVKKKTK